jgi:hypothetical protein
MIEDKIKTHRRNIQMISSVDRQIVELRTSIFNFYTECNVNDNVKVQLVNRLSKLQDTLEEIRLENYNITKDIV